MNPEEKFRSYLPENVRTSTRIRRALTHRSFLNENRHALEDNERLEFLGDSILNFLVADWLYQHFPEKKEGFLTKIRSALVHTQQLASFARSVELGPALHLGKGEAQAGGRDRDAILCNAFEAVIAGIYLESDLETVRNFVIPMMEKQSAVVVSEHSEEDPKSRLQELIQAEGIVTPVYLLVSESGPDHAKVFVVSVIINEVEYAQGKGRSKQTAEKEAAEQALRKLGQNE